jgi:polar amino acid transport system substrate-binding protein
MSTDPEDRAGVDPAAASCLAPSGVLRIGVNLGNPVVARPGAGGGEPTGVGPALGRALAASLGLPVTWVTYPSAGRMADAVREGAWDVAFLAIDPVRAADIAFSEPYLLVEGTYLAWSDAPFRRTAELDGPGRRIAVGAGTAYDLFLTRQLRSAELIREATSQAAIERFLAGGLDAAAGVRQPLEAAARLRPGLRVLTDHFTVIQQAAGAPRGRDAAASLVAGFMARAKRTGLVARLLSESGAGDVTLAP